MSLKTSKKVARRQVSGASMTCNDCPLGEYQDKGGRVSCRALVETQLRVFVTGRFGHVLLVGFLRKDDDLEQNVPSACSSKNQGRCPKGQYQDTMGQTGCNMCPAGTTTLGFLRCKDFCVGMLKLSTRCPFFLKRGKVGMRQ